MLFVSLTSISTSILESLILVLKLACELISRSELSAEVGWTGVNKEIIVLDGLQSLTRLHKEFISERTTSAVALSFRAFSTVWENKWGFYHFVIVKRLRDQFVLTFKFVSVDAIEWCFECFLFFEVIQILFWTELIIEFMFAFTFIHNVL